MLVHAKVADRSAGQCSFMRKSLIAPPVSARSATVAEWSATVAERLTGGATVEERLTGGATVEERLTGGATVEERLTGGAVSDYLFEPDHLQ